MLNLSDKDLDRLSREAAGQYEVDVNISSWEKLELELDKEIGTISAPPSGPGARAALSYISLILLLAGLSFFLLRSGKNAKELAQKSNPAIAMKSKTGNQVPKTEIQNNSGIKGAEAQTKSTPGKEETLEASPIQTTSTAGSLKPGLNNAVQKESISTPNRASANLASNQLKSRVSNQASSRPSGKEGNPAENTRIASGLHPINNRNSVNNNSKGQNRPNGSAIVLANNNKKPGKKSGIASGKNNQSPVGSSNLNQVAIVYNQNAGTFKLAGDQLDKINLPQIQPVIYYNPNINDASLRALRLKTNNLSPQLAESGKKKASLRINRSLHIGLMAAPDFTNVGSAYNNKMSSNIGLTLSYQILNRLSVNTGLIYTRKNYSANGDDFHTSNSWINAGNLQYVQGNCNMFEIPLTIRYDITKIGKTRFFVNGGLSSYLMRHESYDYYFKVVSPPYPSPLTVSYQDHDNYWFSSINLSLGVERQINNSLSMQVEPFAKIPITGIGFGNLQLSTYGLSFSLRFSPVLGRSRQ